MTKKIFKISGMHCVACSLSIEGVLEDVGVEARANYAKQNVEILKNIKSISDTHISKLIESLGYQVI